jgi:hypothetical protein
LIHARASDVLRASVGNDAERMMARRLLGE